jgi:hypothetical protein
MRCVRRPGRAAAPRQLWLRCLVREKVSETVLLLKTSSNATGVAPLVLCQRRGTEFLRDVRRESRNGTGRAVDDSEKKRRRKHLVKNDKLREKSALTERILSGLGIGP